MVKDKQPHTHPLSPLKLNVRLYPKPKPTTNTSSILYRTQEYLRSEDTVINDTHPVEVLLKSQPTNSCLRVERGKRELISRQVRLSGSNGVLKCMSLYFFNPRRLRPNSKISIGLDSRGSLWRPGLRRIKVLVNVSLSIPVSDYLFICPSLSPLPSVSLFRCICSPVRHSLLNSCICLLACLSVCVSLAFTA